MHAHAHNTHTHIHTHKGVHHQCHTCIISWSCILSENHIFVDIQCTLQCKRVPIVSENTCYNCVHVHGSSTVRQELAGIVATMRLALCRRKRVYTLGKSLL